MTWPTLTVPGRIRGKKNRARIIRNRRTGALGLIQEKESVAWERAAVALLRAQWAPRPALAVPLRLVCQVRIHPQQRGDLTNYLSAASDALEKAGVVANDRLFVHITATRTTDRQNPGVTMTLRPIDEA